MAEPDWDIITEHLRLIRRYVGWVLVITLIVVIANVVGSFMLAGQVHDLVCQTDPSCIPS